MRGKPLTTCTFDVSTSPWKPNTHQGYEFSEAEHFDKKKCMQPPGLQWHWPTLNTKLFESQDEETTIITEYEYLNQLF